jgi:hypothetical protein
VLILPPGHAQELNVARRFSVREKWIVGAVLGVVAVLVAIVAISIGSTGHRTANGCIDVKFPIAIGGQELYQCGAGARTLCSTSGAASGPNSVEDRAIADQCRKAGLPVAGPR